MGNIEEVLPHFYFLSSLKDGIMKSIEAWTSRKHHGCLWKSFHFPPFFPSLFFFSFSFMDHEDGLASSLFMPSFTVWNRRKEKWSYTEPIYIYLFLFCHWPTLITFHCAGEGTEMEPYGQKNDQFTHSIISFSTSDIAVFFIRFWRCLL